MASTEINQPKSSGRGGRRAGAGRKVGALTKKTRAIADAAVKEGVTPLEYMLKVLRDEASPTDRRDDMAKAAAPYMHPRLAAVEHSGTLTVNHEDRLRALR